MSYAERHVVAVQSIADGSGVGYTPVVTGRVLSIRYVKDGSNAYADGVDFTITAEATGETLWAEENVNASKSCYPRGPTHSTAGVAALFAAGGQAVNDAIALALDRVKIAIAQAGDTKDGAFHIVIG